MQLNHALILASNLDQMSRFLVQTLDLVEGSRPPFTFDGVWLYDQMNVPCVHIAGRYGIHPSQTSYLGATEIPCAQPSPSTIDHLAFTSTDYDGLKQRLTRLAVPFIERNVPEANQHQVFITGPDNLKIEILFSQKEIH